MDVRAGCCGELFSTPSSRQQPDSPARSHIPRPLNGTGRALLGSEAGSLRVQLGTAGEAAQGKAVRSPANKEIHRGGSTGWEERSHITGNQKHQEEAKLRGSPQLDSAARKTNKQKGMCLGGILWQSQIGATRCYHRPSKCPVFWDL